MAQKYIVQLVDDLTQQPIEDGAGESVRFSLDGVSYTIDLTTDHAEEFRAALSPYVNAARKADVAVRAKSSSSSAPRAPKGDLKAIREWANANGHTVSSRGRIPADVQTAYNAAH
ncbi:histone-like nucleoid-structuring protein Lsr2 [Amnibacterium setariae]|uniref:Lsr2 family protein n=1 Tax=Amnibacterium setariae TaxID=2306585 RepID=A0A3A1U516_9MICO|nr:Lsr2 family protein [Amnibacterium setariae]RIX30547.1 Lsr2 family protein [Amnibacterium setariae]